MPHRKKVLWLIKGLGTGGAEKLLSTAIPFLNRGAFDYEMAYLLSQKNDLIKEFKSADIPIFCLNVRTSFDFRSSYRLFRLLRDRKPEILHIHLPYTGIIGRVIGRLAGIENIIYTEHSIMEMYLPITRMLNLITYPLNDVTIAVSEEVQRSIARYKITRHCEPIVIHNGISLDQLNRYGKNEGQTKQALGIPSNHKIIGNVAHIRPEKGQEYLIRAAKLVINQLPEVTFVVVGRQKSGGDINHLKNLSASLG
ncbi:MAG: glycosyltransferase, partial [Promethearchaeota archaeon]